jgi:ferredoxin
MPDKGTIPDVADREAVADTQPSEEPPAAGRPVLPAQPTETKGELETVRTVRAFCLTGTDPSGRLEVPGKGILPAPMHAMRDPARVRTGEPVVLFLQNGTPGVLPFMEWLTARIDSVFPAAASARVLRDNVLRLERAARRLARTEPPTLSLSSLMDEAADAIIRETGLRAEPADTLRADAAALAADLTAADIVLSTEHDVALSVMIFLARQRREKARAAFIERVERLNERVRRLLEVDAARGGQHDPEALSSAMGSPSGAIDPGQLARVLGETRGPMGMPAERRERLARLAHQFTQFLGAPSGPAVIVVRAEEVAGSTPESSDVEWLASDLPCAEAARKFDRLADVQLATFIAVRVAELEVADRYDAGIHGLFVKSFDRGALSSEETAILPAVIAVEAVQRLCGPDMPNVSRVLLSERPIRVLLETQPASNMLPHVDHEPLAGARFEPGLFGIGLGSAIVHQSSVAATAHLALGFERALGSDLASLHVVATGECEGGAEPTVGRWLHAGAATDGRAHPLFLYDPSPGPSWADRFDFTGNDQPERDWPEHELECEDAAGVARAVPMAFTFADFAILEPAYREHLRLIPDTCPTGDLAPVAEYLAERRDSDRRIPFVWATGPDGRMHRVAVSKRLVAACRNRSMTWSTLQQSAGIHDEYAERAAESARRAVSEDADSRIAQLERDHAEEIERIRREEASEALGRLAESIMGVDLSTLAPTRPARMPAPAAPAAEPPGDAPEGEAAPVVATPEEEEDFGFDELYIDSILCTTCNDCMGINPRVFVYNDNKQAVVGDPDGGTFAEIVAAAEKCPARCIHPGKPRNPDEPNLDALIERAKPFN